MEDRVYYKELAKDEQKKLRKEFESTTNINKIVILIAVVVAVVVISIALLTVFVEKINISDANFWLLMLPSLIYSIFIPYYVQVKLAYWLLNEKDIRWKRKK